MGKRTEPIAEDKWNETSRGVDSINFQRTAHITWVSVLMAMVVVVLAEKIYTQMGQALAEGRLYLLLFVIASALIIIQYWVQTSWLTLISHSPIQIIRTGLTLLNGIAIYIICASVENPAGWFLAVGFFGIISCLSLLFGLRLKLIPDIFARSEYLLLGIVGSFTAVAFLASWHLTSTPGASTAWFWGAAAILMTTAYLWMQTRSMNKEKQESDIP
jgi:hypothetical protein